MDVLTVTMLSMSCFFSRRTTFLGCRVETPQNPPNHLNYRTHKFNVPYESG